MLCALSDVMDSVALRACQVLLSMDALPVVFYPTPVAGSTIGFLQFIGMGQVFRIAMAGRAIKSAMVGFPVFVMAVKTFLRTEHSGRNEKEEDRDGENVPHFSGRLFYNCLSPVFLILPPKTDQSKEWRITFSSNCR